MNRNRTKKYGSDPEDIFGELLRFLSLPRHEKVQLAGKVGIPYRIRSIDDLPRGPEYSLSMMLLLCPLEFYAGDYDELYVLLNGPLSAEDYDAYSLYGLETHPMWESVRKIANEILRETKRPFGKPSVKLIDLLYS